MFKILTFTSFVTLCNLLKFLKPRFPYLLEEIVKTVKDIRDSFLGVFFWQHNRQIGT